MYSTMEYYNAWFSKYFTSLSHCQMIKTFEQDVFSLPTERDWENICFLNRVNIIWMVLKYTLYFNTVWNFKLSIF